MVLRMAHVRPPPEILLTVGTTPEPAAAEMTAMMIALLTLLVNAAEASVLLALLPVTGVPSIASAIMFLPYNKRHIDKCTRLQFNCCSNT